MDRGSERDDSRLAQDVAAGRAREGADAARKIDGLCRPARDDDRRLRRSRQRRAGEASVSGGSGGVFYSLLYTVLNGKTRFAGYNPSHDGQAKR